jgi:MFS family permease
MLVAATAFPLAPTASLAVAWLAVVNFFAAFPWGAASGAVAEIVPAPMRAQGAALYFLILNLVSVTLGPSSVAWLTDYAFKNEASLRYSLAIVTFVAMSLAIVLFLLGLPAYRRTVGQAQRADIDSSKR